MFAFDLPMRALAPAPDWPCLEGETVALTVAAPATRPRCIATCAPPGLRWSRRATPRSRRLVIADAAALKAAPRSPAPVICVGEYGESAPQALQRAGMVDLVLVQPLRAARVGRRAQQVAAGEPISEALADASRSERRAPCPASPAAAFWWPTTAR